MRASRLTARIDNNAVADGFQIYLHSFVLTRRRRVGGGAAGDERGDAPRAPLSLAFGRRARLHCRSAHGNRRRVAGRRSATWSMAAPAGAGRAARDRAETIRRGRSPRCADSRCRHITMSGGVTSTRSGSAPCWRSRMSASCSDFASFLLLEQLGPRTLQSLALVAEVVHGAPTRFEDPARFAFAHGGKDGHPFPVPLKCLRRVDRLAEARARIRQAWPLGEARRVCAARHVRSVRRDQAVAGREHRCGDCARAETVAKTRGPNSA